jgi:hypothetical protein
MKPERKKALSIPMHRWEDDIKTVIIKLGWKKCGLDLSSSDRDQWRTLARNL